MTIKSIYTIVDLNTDPSPARQITLDIASRFGAHVTALAPAVEPYVPGYLAAPMPLDYVMVAVEEGEKLADKAAKAFARAAAVSDVQVETRTLTAMAGTTGAVISQAHLTDLVVIGKESGETVEPMRGALIEGFLFDAGVPTLIVPESYKPHFKLDKVMIAWDGSATSARAVHAAMPLLEETKSVEIVAAASAKNSDKILGGEVAVYLARHGLDVTVHVLDRKGHEPAYALLEHAGAIHADYIVMGAYGHSRIREFIMGGTTRNILDDLTIPVLMAH